MERLARSVDSIASLSSQRERHSTSNISQEEQHSATVLFLQCLVPVDAERRSADGLQFRLRRRTTRLPRRARQVPQGERSAAPVAAELQGAHAQPRQIRADIVRRLRSRSHDVGVDHIPQLEQYTSRIKRKQRTRKKTSRASLGITTGKPNEFILCFNNMFSQQLDSSLPQTSDFNKVSENGAGLAGLRDIAADRSERSWTKPADRSSSMKRRFTPTSNDSRNRNAYWNVCSPNTKVKSR